MKNLSSLFMAFLFLHFTTFAQWSQKKDMPTARYQAASCELWGKIYVIGGSASLYSSMNILEVYDPVTDSWDTTKTDMPTARVELCTGAVDGKIYAIGGATSHTGPPLGMVEVYDPVTDTWDNNRIPMPTSRKGAAVGVIDNKVYIAGGSDNSNFSPSKKLEIYDPANDNWSSGTDMITALYEPEGAVVNDTFYVIGGLIGFPWIGQKTVQKYDPASDSWSIVTDLDTGRVGHTASVVNGKIYVIAGDRQTPPWKTVVMYDPFESNWTFFPHDTPNFMIAHTASVFLDSLIYLFGGSTTSMPNFTPTSKVYSFDQVVDVKSHKNKLPERFFIHQNFPNPFNPITKIKYSIPHLLQVQIKVYDILGKEIETLVNNEKPAGNYELSWNAANLPSGVYFYRIQAGSFIETKKMVLIR
jgi:hypothetical protein